MTIVQLPSEMKAVVLKEPFKVLVEQRPLPQIQLDTDIIMKVHYAGLCGSDLHYYRGHQKPPYNFIIGHESVGHVVKIGSAVRQYKVGDRVICPMYSSCGDCWFCNKEYTSRCQNLSSFGNAVTAGCQAEYFRVPLADTTLHRMPEDIPEKLLVLMADILPTGYSTAMNARRLADEEVGSSKSTGLKDAVAVVIGAGPVGLCAISSARSLFKTVYATDLSPGRIELAKKHGAIALQLEDLKTQVLKATGGRGADAVLEVVGHESALQTAMELARPYGVISSCGVYTGNISIPGHLLYGKNLRLQFGRCSAQKFYDDALMVLRSNQNLFETFVENKIQFDEAGKFYQLFSDNKVAKTVIEME